MKTKSIQKSPNTEKSQKVKESYSTIPPLVKRNILGVGITNTTTNEVLEYLVNIVQKTPKNIFVVTPNPEILLFARSHKDFKNALNAADLAMTDGMQLFRAAKFLGKPLKERIIGTDLVEKVCETVEDWPITVGFLGAGPGVAEKAAECLKKKFPKLKIAFVGQEWSDDGFTTAQKELSYMNNELSKKKEKSIQHNSKFIPQVNVLFVAFGFPKQELWMQEHLNKIPVRVMIGVGGAFDQIANPSLRPPAWAHSLGLGWVYRLVRQPWRIGRQIKLLSFLGMVLQEKLRDIN